MSTASKVKPEQTDTHTHTDTMKTLPLTHMQQVTNQNTTKYRLCEVQFCLFSQ